MRAFIFDLDGTLVDTVYAHALAWQRALEEAGIVIDGWRIHRRIGMSGGLFTRAVAREVGRPLSAEEQERLQRRHGELYLELLPEPRPLPGARDLLRGLHEGGVPFGIATSGLHPEIDASLDVLGVPADVVVIDRGDVLRAKPEPDLFLACQERMGVRREDCYVVGDAVWDLLAARRAGMLSVGLLSGGYRPGRADPGRGIPRLPGHAGPVRLARRAGGHAAWVRGRHPTVRCRPGVADGTVVRSATHGL